MAKLYLVTISDVDDYTFGIYDDLNKLEEQLQKSLWFMKLRDANCSIKYQMHCEGEKGSMTETFLQSCQTEDKFFYIDVYASSGESYKMRFSIVIEKFELNQR